MDHNSASEKKILWTRACRSAMHGVAAVSAVYCAVMCALLVAALLKLKTTDPLNMPELVGLREAFAQHSAEGEKERIRELDLRVRKAYFDGQWRVRTGSLLLLAGAAALVISLLAASLLGRHLPSLPKPQDAERFWGERVSARSLVVLTAVVLFALSVAVALKARTELSLGTPGDQEQREVGAPSEPRDGGK